MEEMIKKMDNRYFSVYRKWGRGNFLHICFESPGCFYRKQGCCIMCDYGHGFAITEEQALAALKDIFQQQTEPVSNMLLGTCGSILDGREIDRTVLGVIFRYLQTKQIDRIILETHYTTVTDDALDFVEKHLPGKKIAVEMGLESGNQMVLNDILKKKIDLKGLRKTMENIKSHGMDIILNVFLGIPGFTVKQQMEDAGNAIHWAYDNGADEVVVFPANIKPNTPLWELYEQKSYRPISHWMLIELLSGLEERQLGTVGVSWYGDRQFAGIDTDIIPPIACDDCRPKLMKFYQDFMDSYDCAARRELLESLRESVECDCFDKFLYELQKG